jgi:phosphonate transport system ATP-binding protein
MLRIEDASVVYQNGVCALDGVSLTFDRGRFIALLGPSGAGKSTLLRCLNGLVRPTRGDVIAGDASIFASRAVLRRHRRQTAMIFQQHHLIGRQTALKNVLIGRLAFRASLPSLLPARRAERRLGLAALDRVDLLERALDRADELSGGQQQRVGIARALIQRPHTILADEPVASLDPTSAARVLDLIQRICREDDITAIVSLHQVELARRFADRIIGLSGGRVVFDGSVDTLDHAALQRIYVETAPTETEPSHESPASALPAPSNAGRRNAGFGRPARARAG